MQVYHDSTVCQSALHPSPPALFPSSHASSDVLYPLPQLVTHIVGLLGSDPVYPSGQLDVKTYGELPISVLLKNFMHSKIYIESAELGMDCVDEIDGLLH